MLATVFRGSCSGPACADGLWWVSERRRACWTKRWDKGTVARKEIQAFVGSLEPKKAKKGVFITTSQFSEDARDYVKGTEKRIVLIDGEELAQLMIDHGIGVTLENRYDIKKVDVDYFSEG